MRWKDTQRMLLERDCELTLVREAVHRCATGGSALLVTGPLGIGRSALLGELAVRAAGQDVHVLRAHAAPMERDFAFGVVRQLFEGLLAAAPAPARERWLREAGAARPVVTDDILPAGEEPDAAPEAVLLGLYALLAAIGAERPLLLLVDDLQWTDRASLRWLAHLAKRLRGLRAVLVCTLRDGDRMAGDPLVHEVAGAADQVLRPGPLSPGATRQLIHRQFGEPADEEFARACQESAAGVPLLLTCVLAGLAAAGGRPSAVHAEAARALRPAHLRDRLAGCLRTQSQPVRDVAAAMATLGEENAPALVAALAGLDPSGCTAALRALHRLGLLAEEGEPRFVHRVVQDAVESAMTMAERTGWQESAASLLYRSGRPAEQVAAQLVAVPAAGHPWSVAVLRAAAQSALRRGAPETAARYLLRALLERAEQNEDRARLLVELAEVEQAFDPSAAERHVAQAMPLLAAATDRAAAALRVAPGVLGTLSPSAVAVLRQGAGELGAAELLEGSARAVALRLEARLRYCGREDGGELGAAVERLRGPGGEPPVCSAAERELLAVLLDAATLSCGLLAAEVARHAGRILEREPATAARAHAVLPLVVCALVAADSPQSGQSWLAARERSRREGGTGADAVGNAEQALVRLACGRPARAREYAERAFDLAASERQHSGALATAALAAVALEGGDPVLTERVLAEAARRPPVGLLETVMLRLLQVSVHARQGRRERALDAALACGRELAAAGWRNPVLFPWRPWAISLSHRLGDTHSAQALAEQEYAEAVSWGAPVGVGRALRLKGRLQETGTGTELLREAVEVLRSSANELELARAMRSLGSRLGRGAEAEAMLRESAELAALCGTPWSGPDGGVPVGSTGGPVLTPTERRVGTLVGGGLTNQEIAETLGVSSRAVEKHLTNSYRKLGISGRRELVAILGQVPPAAR
ncbi:AAA family ATPase [Kitasatospora sp. NPDC008050]|uniref:helix-turn-helix transcriptional regulator n=1 Tax=Kitasatospora sp. NPDC008050 TaxID=3364021 RepID=UPI0036E32707